MGIVTIFAYNILEASYAVKYPRAPLPQTTSPSAATKSKSGPANSPTPKRAFKVLSPNVRRLFKNWHWLALFLTVPIFIDQPSTAETVWVFPIFFSYCCFPLVFTLFNQSPSLPPISNLNSFPRSPLHRATFIIDQVYGFFNFNCWISSNS